MSNDNQDLVQGLCPYCHQELQVPNTVLGINCPACDNRVIIRYGEFHTIESAKKHTQSGKTESGTSLEDEQDSRESFLHEIDNLILKNKKMEALKLYQKSTGAHIQDARKYIDSQTNRLNKPSNEFKRVCSQCSKVWHSLIKREKELTTEATLTAIGGAGNCCNPAASLQANRNRHAISDTLSQLRKCPECGSAKYTETIVFHNE